MKSDVKFGWQADLRSGKFNQGVHCLHNEDGEFCCLGVLCERYRKETGKGEWIRSEEDSEHPERFTFLGEDCVLPREVMEWAGLESCDPNVTLREGGAAVLSHVNDELECNFSTIAQAIERSL
jgi:hypothetical protein